MNLLIAIVTALKLALGIFELWRERDLEKRKRRKDALKEALDAVDNHDSYALTRAFGRMR